MSVGDLWFGNTEFFQAVQAPPRISGHKVGYFDSVAFQNGGIGVAASYGHRREFTLTYPWGEGSTALGPPSIDVFANYRNGEHGSGPFYFADPIAYDTNLCPPHWGSPRLVEQGWPNISPATATFAATAANSYFQPARKGTWAVTTAANATPLIDTTIPYFIIPIPPEYTLQIGCTGAATGTAVVQVESWVNGAAAAGASAALTLLSETGSTRMNATVAGATYAYAKVFITRTSSAASTITPISMMAQLVLTGVSPTLTGVHVRGKGHTGLVFSDADFAEEYLDASSGRHYKAISVSLTEWQGWGF